MTLIPVRRRLVFYKVYKGGGDTDIMIGVTYLKHFPKRLLELESGLPLSEPVFMSKGGSTGVVWGPYSSFENTNNIT